MSDDREKRKNERLIINRPPPSLRLINDRYRYIELSTRYAYLTTITCRDLQNFARSDLYDVEEEILELMKQHEFFKDSKFCARYFSLSRSTMIVIEELEIRGLNMIYIFRVINRK